MKTAVVLSGGGIKGPYQIGVWKALKKLKIKYNIVTGTGIGALNGALMVQNDYHKAISIWKKVSEFNISDQDFEDDIDLKDLFSNAIKNWKFSLSKVDYATILFDVDNLKHKEIKKSELNKNNLADTIIKAAGTYVITKNKKIDKKEFVNGGFFENLPSDLAINRGAQRVIKVDLKELGIKQILSPKDIEIDHIYPRNKINYTTFSPRVLNKLIAFGYNDTMKYYGKLDGNKFTFEKGSLKDNYDKYSNSIVDITKKLSTTDDLLLNAIIAFNDINNILKEKDFSLLHNNILEYLGKSYNLDESLIYKVEDFNNIVLSNFEAYGIVNKLDEKSILEPKNVISYIYKSLNSSEINVKKLVKLMLEYKKEFMGALYITAIEKY